jgi:hypothetical protein
VASSEQQSIWSCDDLPLGLEIKELKDLGWEEFSGKSVGLVSTRPCTKRKEVGGV